MKTIVLDFETYSEADIKRGVFEYASDPTTEILCACWADKDGDEEPVTWGFRPEVVAIDEKKVDVNTRDGSKKTRKVKIKRYDMVEFGREHLDQLFKDLAEGAVISGHNVAFETNIWEIVGVNKYGFPSIGPVEDGRWDCTAARAAACGLPRSLANVGEALKLDIEKDTEGGKVMMRLCKPINPSSNNPDGRDLTPEKYDVLFEYCRQDVRTQRLVDRVLPKLSDIGPIEEAIWKLDAKINDRGVAIDRDTCFVVESLIEEARRRGSLRINELTGGAVSSVTKTTDLRNWVSAQGVDCQSVSKPAIESLLRREELPEVVREVLALRQSHGLSSVAKFKRLLDSTETDGRARGNLMYFGAGTGRWTGKGIQLQNLPRGSVSDVNQLVADIQELSYDALEAKYGSVLEACSSAIRPMIVAPEGKTLIFSDFASIEARVLPWLAKDKDTLDLIRTGRDMYKEMAVDIFSVEYDEVTKEQRQVGKAAILGLGYSMGKDKFYETLRTQGIKVNYELAEHAVEKYRERFELIKKLWYGTEKAAIRAMKNPGQTTTNGRLKFWRRSETSALYMILPSGRRLCFFDPKVGTTTTPWGQEKEQLSFKKQISTAGMKFLSARTYGGDLVQTATQATARDVMAESMLLLEQNGYTIINTVHDEVIIEVPKDHGSAPHVEHVMSVNPKWAKGLPIAAEAQSEKRYRK